VKQREDKYVENVIDTEIHGMYTIINQKDMEKFRSMTSTGDVFTLFLTGRRSVYSADITLHYNTLKIF